MSGFGAPGAPGGQAQWGQIPQGVGGPSPSQYGVSRPAGYGLRVGGYLLDGLIGFAVGLPASIVGNIWANSDDASAVLGIAYVLLLIVSLAFSFYNFVYLQGRTGQTIGKRVVNTRLVADATGQPVGMGMSFVRGLVGGLLGFVTCGIYFIADYLWPLFDPQNKRLTDKILNFSVITP